MKRNHILLLNTLNSYFSDILTSMIFDKKYNSMAFSMDLIEAITLSNDLIDSQSIKSEIRQLLVRGLEKNVNHILRSACHPALDNDFWVIERYYNYEKND